jgi:hypothetical protein
MFDHINPDANSCRDWSAYTCVKCKAAIIGYSNYLDHRCKPGSGKDTADKPVNDEAVDFMGIN